jgi:hypothetical protein
MSCSLVVRVPESIPTQSEFLYVPRFPARGGVLVSPVIKSNRESRWRVFRLLLMTALSTRATDTYSFKETFLQWPRQKLATS